MRVRNFNGHFLVFIGVLLIVPACNPFKVDKNQNCLNPQASCHNRDKEAPKIVATIPPSQPTIATPAAIATLSSLILSFSEPMKNASDLSNYPNPTGAGNTLNVNSVTKLNEQTYVLSLSGGTGNGNIVFDVSGLTDLAGNLIQNGTITLIASNIAAVPQMVTSSGGYLETNVTWTNTTPYTMAYVVKKNGTDCSNATAVTGTNVTGTVASNGQVVTNLGFAQINVGAANTIRVCLSPITAGGSSQLTVDVTRDDVAPTLSTLTLNRCELPYAITLTCTDNVDRIILTIDGSTPSFTVTASGSSIGAVASPNSFSYSLTGGYSLTTHGLVTIRYLCIDRAGHLNTGGVLSATCQSKGVWNDTNWFATSPTQPYDVWD